jgi:hypothetical protein
MKALVGLVVKSLTWHKGSERMFTDVFFCLKNQACKDQSAAKNLPGNRKVLIKEFD